MCFRPLTEFILFKQTKTEQSSEGFSSFRPLSGFSLFRRIEERFDELSDGIGFRPLMGFSLFRLLWSLLFRRFVQCFRPLMGYSLFRHYRSKRLIQKSLIIELRLKLICHICN